MLQTNTATRPETDMGLNYTLRLDKFSAMEELSFEHAFTSALSIPSNNLLNKDVPVRLIICLANRSMGGSVPQPGTPIGASVGAGM